MGQVRVVGSTHGHRLDGDGSLVEAGNRFLEHLVVRGVSEPACPVRGNPVLLALDNDPEGRAHDRLTTLLTERSANRSARPIPEHHGDLNAWHAANRDHWPSAMRTL